MGQLPQQVDGAAGDDRAVAELVADRVDGRVEPRQRRVGEQLELALVRLEVGDPDPTKRTVTRRV